MAKLCTLPPPQAHQHKLHSRKQASTQTLVSYLYLFLPCLTLREKMGGGDKQPDVAPGENPDKTEEEVAEMNAKLDAAFDGCVEEAKKADDTGATQATTDFLEKMLGPDSKVCVCT